MSGRILPCLPVALLLSACIAAGPTDVPITLVLPPTHTPAPVETAPAAATPTAAPSAPNLRIDPASLSISPGQPHVGDVLEIAFTVHNDGDAPASGALVVAVMIRDHMPRSFFRDDLLVDLPAGSGTPVSLKPGELTDSLRTSWFAEIRDGGYTLAVSVNRALREPVDFSFQGGRFYWHAADPHEPDDADNVVETSVEVLPFEAYTSDACPPGVNLALTAADVSLERIETPQIENAEGDFLALTVHNTGNLALYKVPVRIVSATGLRFNHQTLVLKPCGGTDRLILALNPGWGDIFTVTVNPAGGSGTTPEEDYSDNEVTVNLSELATPAP